MTRPRVLLAVLSAGLTLVVVLGAALGQGDRLAASGSSVARGSGGWLVAREYVGRKGSPTRMRRTPVRAGSLEGVFVTAGSLSSRFSSEETSALQAFVDSGGRWLWGYSRAEADLVDGGKLGVRFRPCRDAAISIDPVQYRAEAAGLPHATADSRVVTIRPVRLCPTPQSGDVVLFRSPGGEPVGLIRASGRGEIVVVPDETFSNGRLLNEGNAAALEGLRQRFGDSVPWVFDEHHHGLTEGPSVEGGRARRGFALFLIQSLLAYGLFALASARTFGPQWPEEAPLAGATTPFLRAVAAIHDRLGHHGEAADRLRERAREVLGISVVVPPGPRMTDRERLMATARAMDDEQNRRKRT